MPDLTVGFVGMTHLGLVSATACAAKGFKVICMDADEVLIGSLADGQLPVVEPDLVETLVSNGARQRFDADLTRATDCDVVYVATDVPTDDEARSDLSGIEALIGRLLQYLGDNTALVVLCQVPPGFTRSINFPAERLYYQVETLVFGQAVERASRPERFIVGCATPSIPLHTALATVLDAYDCPVLQMRYESAELAKISINMCLVSSVTVANTMAEVCEHVDADWGEIVPALKLDKRIGSSAYLTPGLGIAGGNLERDLATVLRLSESFGTDAGVVRAWLANSRYRKGWAARRLSDAIQMGADSLIAVWGLAYKENTHSTKNSPSVATLGMFPDTRFRAYDPVVEAKCVDHAHLESSTDPLSALDGAVALMILTPWPEFRQQSPDEIASRLAGRTVIDPYRVLASDDCVRAGLEHHVLGMSP
jgi:UDPglucose 6-dehydrogenase